jgi:glycosyltransferase involved in cell wall biosynthesis
VADWYAAADVVALASLQEGQPVAVLEALACARGVVATSVGGVPEVVLDGETGWLVPPRSSAALRQALAEALADQQECDRRGQLGRERTVARHSSEAVGRTLLELLSR